MGTGMRASGVGTRDHENPSKRMEEKWLHSPDVKGRHFWSAALKTTAHLLRHIGSADLRDKAVADTEFNQRFTLPALGSIERTLASSVHGMRGSEPESTSIASVLTSFEQIATPKL